MINLWCIRLIGILVTAVAITMLIAMWANADFDTGTLASGVLFSFLGSCGVWLAFNAHQV